MNDWVGRLHKFTKQEKNILLFVKERKKEYNHNLNNKTRFNLLGIQNSVVRIFCNKMELLPSAYIQFWALYKSFTSTLESMQAHQNAVQIRLTILTHFQHLNNNIPVTILQISQICHHFVMHIMTLISNIYY